MLGGVMMYPIFLMAEVITILVGTHTDNIKAKIAATTILILLGIITIWFAISELIA